MARRKEIKTENTQIPETEPQLIGREYPIGDKVYVIYKERFNKRGQHTFVKLDDEIVFETNRGNLSSYLNYLKYLEKNK